IIGSGINSLACGALLARAGWRVCVLERNEWLGGAIHTAELTEPGWLHDVFSAWHPLWVGGAAHAQLGDDLAARGLEYLNTDLPTATAFPDGHASFLLRTAEGNADELGPEWPGVLQRFFPNADRAFGVRSTEGETVTATDAVICCVTPTQLYQRLLADAGVPPEVAEGARRFRYGRSEMQIHFALSEPARWDGDERLNRTAIVH